MDQPHKEFLNGAKEEGAQQAAVIPPEAKEYVQHEGEMAPAAKADINHSTDGSVVVTGEVAIHKPQNAEHVEINTPSAPQTRESFVAKITGGISNFFHGVHNETKMNVMFTPDWDANKTEPYKKHLDSLKGGAAIEAQQPTTPEVLTPSATAVPTVNAPGTAPTIEVPSMPQTPTPIQAGVENLPAVPTPPFDQSSSSPQNVVQFPGSPDIPKPVAPAPQPGPNEDQLKKAA